MDNFSRVIVGNIKQEPEENFVLSLPVASITEEEIRQRDKELTLVVKKFDAKMKLKAEWFAEYLACHKCDYVIRSPRFLEHHLRTTHDSDCRFCDYSGDNQDKKHKSIDHRNGSNFRCLECPYTTTEKGNLVRHCRAHSKKFSCETCGEKFTMPFNLKNHQQRTRHGTYATTKKSEFVCKECSRSFVTKHGLYVHHLNVHRQHDCQCDVCGKSFKGRQLIKQHMQTHAKVPCPICRHKVVYFRMKVHIKQHNPSTRVLFKCEACGKTLTSCQSLNKHRRIHERAKASGNLQET